jgi:hypothetical protein
MGILEYLSSWFTPASTYEQKEKYLDDKVFVTGNHLQWRTSVVDLLKVMGQDSSLGARAALAKELGYSGHFTGTTEQNDWLHKQLIDHLVRK